MSFLTDEELAQMREDVDEGLLSDVCIIQEFTLTSDGAGGNTVAWTAVSGGTVACRFDPDLDRTQPTLPTAEVLQLRGVFTLPYDAPINATRRIFYDGSAWELRELFAEHSWRVSIKAKVARII